MTTIIGNINQHFAAAGSLHQDALTAARRDGAHIQQYVSKSDLNSLQKCIKERDKQGNKVSHDDIKFLKDLRKVIREQNSNITETKINKLNKIINNAIKLKSEEAKAYEKIQNCLVKHIDATENISNLNKTINLRKTQLNERLNNINPRNDPYIKVLKEKCLEPNASITMKKSYAEDAVNYLKRESTYKPVESEGRFGRTEIIQKREDNNLSGYKAWHNCLTDAKDIIALEKSVKNINKGITNTHNIIRAEFKKFDKEFSVENLDYLRSTGVTPNQKNLTQYLKGSQKTHL
jgi:hypothetical protein